MLGSLHLSRSGEIRVSVPFITAKAREVSMGNIPEIALMDKIIAGGSALTADEREYLRQLRHEADEDRDDYTTRDQIDSEDSGLPCRGEI
jgi:hypothetical protein